MIARRTTLAALIVSIAVALPAHAQDLWFLWAGSTVSTDYPRIKIGKADEIARIIAEPTSTQFTIQNKTPGPTTIHYSDGLVLRAGTGTPAGAIVMHLLSDGRVGIGTSSPDSELAVNGTITAREVQVTAENWPDFVLAEGYELMPLAEVEAAIETSGHLPGVPSAREVAEKGIGVGEMQAVLLRKIEELTLHVIALERENDELASRLASVEVSR